MRCKNCKEQFEVKRFNQKYCLNPECQTKEAMANLKKIKEKEQKDWTKRKREIKIKHGLNTKKAPKQVLQDEINKLARMIDNHFNLP